jgi:hypothetical protein
LVSIQLTGETIRCIAHYGPFYQCSLSFRELFGMQYAGIRYAALSSPQQAVLLELIEAYIGNIRPGHAEIRMAEVN